MLAIAYVISNILGFLRDALLADKFGASRVLDIYQAAFKIPDFTYNILVFGAISAGFIPVFVQSYKKNSDEAWKLTSDILNIIFVFLSLISAVLFAVAPWLVHYIVPGFNQNDMNVTVVLTRIMLLQPIFLGLGTLLGGVLQSIGRFLIYSFCFLFYNIGIIIGILFFVPIMGIYGLGWGVVLGSFMYFVLFFISTVGADFKYSFIFNLSLDGVKKIIFLMIPRTLSLIITQINVIITTILASTLSVGSIAIFNFANDLQTVPVSVFGVSLAAAAFPMLSLYGKKEKKAYLNTFVTNLRQILFFIIPSAFLFFVLRAQIVRFTLGYGHFDWHDTLMTVNTLVAFCVGIVGEGLQQIIIRAFFAMEDAVSPFFSGLANVVVNLALGIYLKSFMGVAGLALAFSIAVWVDVIIMFVIFYFKTHFHFMADILKFSMVVIAVSAVSALMAHFSLYAIDAIVSTSKVSGILIQLLVASLIAVASFIAISLLCRIPEANLFLIKIKSRFKIKEIDNPADAVN